MARSTLTSQISGQIVDFIRSRSLRAGSHLPLQPLANEFRVSRAPIMSALRYLEQEGIVRSEQNRGFFLAVDGNAIDRPAGEDREEQDVDESTYFRIAEDRFSGRLAERVTENELMRSYDIPRSQLLRILRRISEEGWIERLPGNGWEFRQTLTSRRSYEDGYAFRAAIEQQALLLETFKMDAEAFARARERQSALLAGGFATWSRADIFRTNNDFHEMLVGCSRNAFFLDSIQRINRLRRLIEYHITIDRTRLPQQTREHLHILDLLEEGRREDAAAFLYRHIRGAGRIKTPQV